MKAIAALGLLGAVAVASPALADPCEARVTGYHAGQTITGPVRYVGDGDGLCIGASRDPGTWVEIRLADYFAPELQAPGGAEAKALLERLVRGKTLSCRVQRGQNGRTSSYDRLIASCTVDGRSLAGALRDSGGRVGGNGYRPARR